MIENVTPHNLPKLAWQLLVQGKFPLTFDQVVFPLSDLSLKKRFSLLKSGVRTKFGPVFKRAFPPIIQIEPTNTCNLKCLTCATGSGLISRPSTFMSFDTFRKIIDQVHMHACLLVFWSWGEPFIHKNACDMIRYAKNSGLLVHTSTNGHFFTHRKNARKVIESGLDSLIVAVDGLDQNTYEKYRKGGNLQRVKTSIKNIVKERAAACVQHPRITLRFIVMKHNEHQVNQVNAFAKNLGVDAVAFRTAAVSRGKINLESSLTPSTEEYQRNTVTRHRKKNFEIHLKIKCHRPYANLTIFANGDVVTCERDMNAILPMGNVNKQSIE
ncbi:MAG: radical SAM protein, partial [Desulfobacterales bacterium]|nr:radical SAM protein [Desulfobacterales bacterium]